MPHPIIMTVKADIVGLGEIIVREVTSAAAENWIIKYSDGKADPALGFPLDQHDLAAAVATAVPGPQPADRMGAHRDPPLSAIQC
jgi:hypothetical protein